MELTQKYILEVNPQDVDMDRLYEAGCDDYLPKPIRFEDLLNSIGKLINR